MVVKPHSSKNDHDETVFINIVMPMYNLFTRHLQKAVTQQNFVYEYLVGNP